MNDLTRAEEQIMQVLWSLKGAFVKDVLACLPEPKPAYNTVSTIIRILESKGFVAYEAFGKSHRYFPLLEKETYLNRRMDHLLGQYFNGSFSQLVSFFARDKKLDIAELDAILQELEKEKP